MQKSKEDKQYDDLGKLMKLTVSRWKTWEWFNLNYLQDNKFTMIEWKFYNRFFPKSKATSCSTYSRDPMQAKYVNSSI